jgi:hypothetical protein
MLQNRVDPFGNIIKTSARGAWMGNRGILHDEHQNVLRPFKLKAWITCVLQFRGRKREVMAPNRYTELFFMDEVTAFSAGHRPCFECRRADYNSFKDYWLKGNPGYGFNEKTSINEIDKILHSERRNRDGSKVTYEDRLADLPDGTFVVYSEKPYLLAKGQLHEWSAGGYVANIDLPEVEMIAVLTPKSTVNAFRAGYVPQMAVFD